MNNTMPFDNSYGNMSNMMNPMPNNMMNPMPNNMMSPMMPNSPNVMGSDSDLLNRVYRLEEKVQKLENRMKKLESGKATGYPDNNNQDGLYQYQSSMHMM